jgi:hypothetical protein
MSTADNAFNRVLLMLRNSSILALFVCLFKTFQLYLNYCLYINIETSELYQPT